MTQAMLTTIPSECFAHEMNWWSFWHIISVCRLASREFAEGLPTKRAIRTAPARGHIYSVQFHEGARHVADVLAKKRAPNSLADSPRATEG